MAQAMTFTTGIAKQKSIMLHLIVSHWARSPMCEISHP